MPEAEQITRPRLDTQQFAGLAPAFASARDAFGPITADAARTRGRNGQGRFHAHTGTNHTVVVAPRDDGYGSLPVRPHLDIAATSWQFSDMPGSSASTSCDATLHLEAGVVRSKPPPNTLQVDAAGDVLLLKSGCAAREARLTSTPRVGLLLLWSATRFIRRCRNW